MRLPTIADLPQPPRGKTGWPWTSDRAALPVTMPDGCTSPRISIVTPSFNQGQFIEETIRSVLLQGYPNLEYIIIDGGSTDNSVEIIKKYEPWLTYWVSQPDGGQAAAINAGFLRASGDIFAWLNSDDLLFPGAVGTAAKTHLASGCDVAYGNRLCIDENDFAFGFDIAPQRLYGLHFLLGMWIPQESLFFRRDAYEGAGKLDNTLRFALDYDLVIKMFVQGMRFVQTQKFLGMMRFHSDAKSSRIASIGQREFDSLRLHYLMRGNGKLLLRLLVDPIFGRISFRAARANRRWWVLRKRISFVAGRGYVPHAAWIPAS